ncbi:MAG: heme o synthase [Anaerolineae bacterium]
MTLESPAVTETARPTSLSDTLRMLGKLFKFRVVLLLLWAAMGGAFLGAGGLPPVRTLLTLLVTGALAAGGASAINEYVEQDIDARMLRTQGRPLPTGQIRRPWIVLAIAALMILAAILIALPTNPMMALYLGLGAAIYVGVYTLWLKPRSVVNIVIGSAAGSCAVMTGGAAVGAAADPAVIVLALLLFTWSPTHFWALALYYKDDYARGRFPMLPVNTSPRTTSWWIFLHTASTALAALALALTPQLGWPYLLPAGAITFLLLARSIRLIRTPERRQAIGLFITSNIFLLVILLSIIAVTTGRHLLS